MDRKRHSSLVVILVGILLMIVISIGVYWVTFLHMDTSITELEQEIEGVYPEQSVALQNMFDYYEAVRKKQYFLTAIGGTLVLSLLMIGLILVVKYLHKDEEHTSRENLQGLLEIMERFRRGKYEVNKEKFLSFREARMKKDWDLILDKLQEVGHYLNTLQMDTMLEEQKTKALVTDISHQLKTPLASLRMNYDLARQEELCDEEREAFRKQEEQDIERLEQLLEELVNVSRLESGMILVQPRLGSLQELIGQVIGGIYTKAKKKELEFRVECEEKIILKYDPKWTVEAISNVLDNAVKYAFPHTTIRVKVHRLPELIVLEVEDEGIKITREEYHKIFHRFYRGREAKEQDFTGAGVGLYLTRYILNQQGGTITAQVMENGMSFRITLPY